MFIFVPMADRTKTIAGTGFLPTFLDTLDAEGSQPFIWIVPLLPLLIDMKGCHRSHDFGTIGGRRLLVRPNNFKFVVVAYVHHNRIKGGALKRLVTGPKLLQQVIVARMEQTEEKHDHENWRNDNFALSHIVHHPIKMGAESHNLLQLSHAVIEEWQEGCEGICNRVRAAMLTEGIEHLRAFAIICGAFVFK
jgi:hypothetical protein